MELAESIAAMAAGRMPLPAYDRTMGFRLVSWQPTGAVIEAGVDARFANPTGVLHGGVLAGLADSAMGITASGVCPPGHWATNTDVAIRFFLPTMEGKVRATARVVRKGRRVLAMECDLTVGDKLVARASSNFLFLEGKPSAK